MLEKTWKETKVLTRSAILNLQPGMNNHEFNESAEFCKNKNKNSDIKIFFLNLEKLEFS